MLFVRELGFIRQMHSSIVVSFSDTINTQKQKFAFMGQKCIKAYMHNMHTSDHTCNLISDTEN